MIVRRRFGYPRCVLAWSPAWTGISRSTGVPATARDLRVIRRFDGRFFTGVLTTRIYCRPICPVKPAQSRNVVFFPTAAAAERAGFRPCLRCRPEAAPGTPAWRGAAATVSRALRLIERGFLDDGQSVAGPRGHARHDAAPSAAALPAACGSLADGRGDDPARAAGEDAGRRNRDADVGDCVRRRLRQHPALQRGVSRRVPAAAQHAPQGATSGRPRPRCVTCDRISPAREGPPHTAGQEVTRWTWGCTASTRS